MLASCRPFFAGIFCFLTLDARNVNLVRYSLDTANGVHTALDTANRQQMSRPKISVVKKYFIWGGNMVATIAT